MSNKAKLFLTAAIFISVLIIDQIIKVNVKTGMALGEHKDITNWFIIAFVENKGMAFGWELGDKVFLTLFRIIAVIFIGGIIVKQIRIGRSTGFITCLAMIMGGAAGNIIDCLFYGEIFSESTPYNISQYVGWGNGYGDFLQGKVVDMFYFPLIEWNMPSWSWLNTIPFLPSANEHCVFFSPVFNFADASITVGVVLLLLFFRNDLNTAMKDKVQAEVKENGSPLVDVESHTES